MKPFAIKFDKSVSKGHLCYRHSSDFVWEIITEYALLVVWVTTILLVFWQNRLFDNLKDILFSSLVIALTIWLLLGYYFLDQLVFIKCDKNKKIENTILPLIRVNFPKAKIDTSSSKILTAGQSMTRFRWGKEISCLITDNGFYLNITTLGRGDLRSPFHAVTNYLKCKRFKEQIEQF